MRKALFLFCAIVYSKKHELKKAKIAVIGNMLKQSPEWVHRICKISKAEAQSCKYYNIDAYTEEELTQKLQVKDAVVPLDVDAQRFCTRNQVNRCLTHHDERM